MAKTTQNNVDEDELRRMKLEVALEVKSLRRIISAYLNYPEAAEEDVRRNERSFQKLPQAHKELLSHLPSKFQKLRWCILKNSFFIFEMLKAFEPPLDMSQDIDLCEKECQRNVQNNSVFTGETTLGSCRLLSADGRGVSHCIADAVNPVNVIHNAPKEMSLHQYDVLNVGSCSVGERKENEFCPTDGSAFSSTCCNGNVISSTPDWLDPSLQLHVPLVDVDKVRCIIRNIVRDWAAEGEKERDQCYKPILEALHNLFPHRNEESPPCCLVPGAGLGRLALEISRIGFICQGNEFSYYMMICSSFILNHTQTSEEWTIYPWIHSNSNSLSDSDQFRPISIPDVHPASAGTTEGFSMCGGDFVEVYSDPSQIGAWDSVVTCFFLDTAHNIVEYIEIISRILKEGAVWINLGPLLYHFADTYGQDDEMSIELSLEDVKRVALHYGFKFEQCSTIETTYTTNPRSMMQNRYFAAFWILRKSAHGNQEDNNAYCSYNLSHGNKFTPVDISHCLGSLNLFEQQRNEGGRDLPILPNISFSD
ncbi:OLC1v1013038C1 [Oldenlandia corymbosa var. corymbosa]|uniref:carnosine N-methyltransferase n=1 Tax=Oldenlandia corymbosa var. corymbosa TaxID=529605 RepID=A0AAV1DXA0_OLDCO|nr:OLC1v1013038C1 [Oldenlandia corymbosa var. corymbosa]